MRKFRIEKSAVFLIIILIILAVSSVMLMLAMRADPIAEAVETDQLFKVLIVLEENGKPLITNVLVYYPASRRGALFDIPGETGLIIKSLGRVDRIDALYTEKNVKAYKSEIENLTGISIPFELVMNMDQFSALTDLLGGLKVFIPSPVDVETEDGSRFLLPSGSVMLDGDKIRTYIKYILPEYPDADISERRQDAVVSFLWALGEKSGQIFEKEFFPAVAKNISSNLDTKSLAGLLSEIARVDSERLSPQRLTGSMRSVDGQMLLFPFDDGQLIKDIVKRTTGTLASSGEVTHERIYVIEILNGTTTQRLAQNTSNLYQSFGYDVLRVGNAERNDYAETIIVDHIGNQAAAKNLGEIIQCSRFKSTEVLPEDAGYADESLVDFTIILGKDFNGRYVR